MLNTRWITWLMRYNERYYSRVLYSKVIYKGSRSRTRNTLLICGKIVVSRIYERFMQNKIPFLNIHVMITFDPFTQDRLRHGIKQRSMIVSFSNSPFFAHYRFFVNRVQIRETNIYITALCNCIIFSPARPLLSCPFPSTGSSVSLSPSPYCSSYRMFENVVAHAQTRKRATSLTVGTSSSSFSLSTLARYHRSVVP